MYLPENALFCIQRLESAHFPCYAVGGCVRDALLGLTPHDYDLCTAATPALIKVVFADFPLLCAGEKHGTVGVLFPDGEIIEITAFRTEDGYSDSRHPDRVRFVDDIVCDLARRDFTVNAMAYSPTRGLCDPFGGRADLQARLLRAVGEPRLRFSEDALRILRGVRFCATYDLTPDDATQDAMFSLAHTMEKLSAERVFDELCKLLLHIDAEKFLRFAPVLTAAIPELRTTLGFAQHNPHHRYDVYTHTAQVLAATPPTLPLRWAALLHDIEKPACFSLDAAGVGHFYGHAERSAETADAVLRRLKAPNALRERVVLLVRMHMTPIEPTQSAVRRRLSRLGTEAFDELLALQEADMGGKEERCCTDAPNFELLRSFERDILAQNACLHVRDLAVDGNDLLALGYRGREIGTALQSLLDAVLDGRCENEKTTLLALLQTTQAR